MNRHASYPYTYPTQSPTRHRVKRFMRFLRWLVLFLVVLGLAIGAALVILRLQVAEAQQDSIFNQGMQAGFSMCKVGV